MRSHTTPRFWQLYAVRLFAFESCRGTDDLYTVRIGDRYRAIGYMESGEITWTWIGSHADYNNLT